jgi:acyl-CoA synthetase (AMP-forming)/AMP-acid ligase II
MNLSRILESVARTIPDAPSITASDQILDYAALVAQTDAIATALLDRHNIARGARIALVMENCAEFYPCLYAIWRAGLVAVPINAKLHPRELAWIIADCQARLVIATPDLAEQMTSHADTRWPEIIATGSADYQRLLTPQTRIDPPADPDDIAWLFYTSGTTGRPKGAVLTHRNLLFMCHCYYADIDRIGVGDAILHAAPLSHGSSTVLRIFRADRIMSSSAALSILAASTGLSRSIRTCRCLPPRRCWRVSSIPRRLQLPTRATSRRWSTVALPCTPPTSTGPWSCSDRDSITSTGRARAQ